MGLKIEDIQAGLVSFNPTIGQLPGRMNLIDIENVKVMIDYAHNASAIKALGELIPHLATGRKISVNHGTGNRLENDIMNFGRAIGGIYDKIFLSDADPKDRPFGETRQLVLDGVLSTGFSEDSIIIFDDERQAAIAALEDARDGDIVVIQACDVQQIIKDVLDYKESVTHV